MPTPLPNCIVLGENSNKKLKKHENRLESVSSSSIFQKSPDDLFYWCKAHFFTSKYVPAAGRQRKFSPDVSTFDQHLGGNLPTPNINVLEGPFQQFVGPLTMIVRKDEEGSSLIDFCSLSISHHKVRTPYTRIDRIQQSCPTCHYNRPVCVERVWVRRQLVKYK